MTVRPFLAVALLFFLFASPVHGEPAYTFEIIAKTGQTLPNMQAAGRLGRGPSINDAGDVAFTACASASCDFFGKEGVFVGRPGSLEERAHLVDTFQYDVFGAVTHLTDYYGFGDLLQVNNHGQVVWRAVARDGLGGTFILRLGETAADFKVVSTNTFFNGLYTVVSPFAELRPGLTLSNHVAGQTRVVFSGVLAESDPPATVLGTPVDTETGNIRFPWDFHFSAPLKNGPLFFPQISDFGETIVRGGATSTAPIASFPDGRFDSAIFIAATGIAPEAVADGFVALGEKPGVSDDGRVVAFMAHHASNGVGIYVSLLVPVAGGYTYTPPSKIASLADLSSFSLAPRVAVNRSGTSDDVFTVVYLATAKSSMPGQLGPLGLYTTTIDITNPAAPVIGPPELVLQVGNTVPGLDGAVQDIALYDPINNRGQLAFWVRTTSAEAIVRANNRMPLIVNIVTHGFNPTPPPIGTWEGFRRGWHVMAKKLNAIPTDGAALSGRVATYVAEWESSAGFWDGFVYLIAAKAAEAGAEEAELAGDHAKAAKFSQRAAAHKAAARKLASTSAQHASDAADKIVKDVTALGAGLLLPDPAQSRAAQQRVHLIAHSRGAAVNARVAKRLVKMGYYVDQYTALDGFSTDWPDDAGMIGDISIVDEAAVSDPAVGRKVSYRVGKDLGDYILDHIPPVGQPILNPFVQAIKLWLAFTAEKDLPDDLALLGDGAIQIILTFLDLRAPERVSFEAPNPILAGLAVDAPDCLGGIGQKIEGDKDGESSHVTATQMYACSDVLNVATKYIFDNFVGKYRDAKTLPPLPPLPAVLASALGPAAAAAADATDFRDGGFEQLGSLAGSIQRSDSAPTGVPIVDLAYEALSKPSGVLELLWEVSGDVRLIDEGGNTVVELRQTAGTALGQFVRVGNAASRLEFDLWVPQRGVDGKLQISFAGEVLETVALASAVDGHYSIPVGHIAGRTGQIEFVLMGFDTGSSVVRLDNLVILSAGVVHDLSVVKITASPTVTLTDRVPVRTERVAVRIQSQSSHDEVIPNLDTLNALVSLKVESLGPCASPVPTLVQGAPQVKLPFALKPKRMFNVVFDVEFGCSNDPARSSSRSPGHGDYRYRAIVDHAALNGESDDDPSDDVCPRTVAPPFRVDPNPDGKIRDRGCGSRKADGTLGGDVVIDVIDRR